MGIARRVPRPAIKRTRPIIAVFSLSVPDVDVIVEGVYLKAKRPRRETQRHFPKFSRLEIKLDLFSIKHVYFEITVAPHAVVRTNTELPSLP